MTDKLPLMTPESWELSDLFKYMRGRIEEETGKRVAAAVATERDACAKEVEKQMIATGFGDDDPTHTGTHNRALKNAAGRIRSRAL
jgi:hypothetical protein